MGQQLCYCSFRCCAASQVAQHSRVCGAGPSPSSSAAAEGMEKAADSDPLPQLSSSYFFLWKSPPLQLCLQKLVWAPPNLLLVNLSQT